MSDCPSAGSAAGGCSAARRVLVAVGLLVTLAFLPSLGNGIVWDQHHLSEAPGAFQRPASIPWFFFGTAGDLEALGVPIDFRTYYRPLELTAYALLHPLFGTRPLGYAALGILAHAVNACLLAFWVLRAWGRPPLALLAGLSWGLHPVAATSAGWPGVRPDLAAGACLFLSLLAVQMRPIGPRRAAAAAALFAGALFAKEASVTLPLAVTLALLLAPGQRPSREEAGRLLLGWLVALLGYLVLRARALPAEGSWGPSPIGPWEYGGNLAQSCLLLWLSAGLFAWPWPLGMYTFEHLLRVVRDAAGAGAPGFGLGNVLTMALTAGPLAAVARAPAGPAKLGLALFAAMALPVLKLVPVRAFPFLFGDRHLYLPAAGLALAAAAGLEWLGAVSGRRGVCAAGLLLGVWAAFGVNRQLAFRDDEAFFAHELARAPASARLHYDRARDLGSRARGVEATPYLQTAVGLDPGFTAARTRLVECLWNQRRLASAVAEFDELERRDPHAVLHRTDLLPLLDEAGHRDRARRLLAAALSHSPEDPAPLEATALLALRWGNVTLARQSLQRALELQPTEGRRQALRTLDGRAR